MSPTRDSRKIDVTSFILKPRPPFRLDLTVWALRRRAENAIDDWDGDAYRRVISIAESPTMIEVRQLSGSGSPRLSVQVHCDHTDDAAPELRGAATAAVERLLGIRIDLQLFLRFAAGTPKLGPLARRFRGMKPPRFLTGFECLANAIACQQISLAVGIQLLNRFGKAFGRAYQDNGVRRFAFPRPDDLIQADKHDLRAIGFSRQKAAALLNLAGLARSGEFDLKQLQALSDEAVVGELCRLRGVGRWTAEYAMLRGMGRLHVFPGDDVGARNNLNRWLAMSEELDYDSVERVLKRWHPFGGLIYLHLLLDKLVAVGYMQSTSTGAVSNGQSQ